ncbi:MAG: T9SS type A sorting domain-containing protein [Muribaculaceae bacterium]|nr:T9SS type A sorting domain-containing protein [Muribaculaceae bacterium]
MNYHIRHLIGAAIVAAAVAMPASAAAEKGVVVISADGTRTEATLADVQRIDIGKESLTLHHSGGQKHEVAFADLDRILIGAETSAVKDLIGRTDIAIWPTRTSSTVSATGLEPGCTFAAHSTAGALVAKATADADGNATIDLSSAAAGVYIVSAGKHSVKIIKN